ncbi:MAG: hypothetical protein HZA47_07540 [Planctomycetes bacterium]|uniref:hypothetical protein n=1 Tax=Candidatus Wunengus sp. YC65 TaxID=3367701 RepID=UPI001D56EFEB|nr:hypothetical protein [Planctomycetota bacterium]
MNHKDLITELSKYIDNKLATDLVYEFLEIRKEIKAGILGRSSCGKFIETVVQVLQYLNNSHYDENPNVDFYLKNLESQNTAINDDFKICCSRIARSCYTLRNKRNIAHKGSVDPNIYDLRYIYTSAQWILSEIVRQVITSSMTLAGRMIEFIQIPVSTVVEDFGDRRLVYGNLSIEQELLVLLHSYYPENVSRQTLTKSLDRRSTSAISNSLNTLWNKKLVHEDKSDYKLTQEGFKESQKILQTFN